MFKMNPYWNITEDIASAVTMAFDKSQNNKAILKISGNSHVLLLKQNKGARA